MTHRLRRSLVALTFIALLFIALGLGLNFVLNTSSGARWTINTANKFIPGKISYAKLQGRLIGPLSIEQFSYQSKHTQVRVAQLHLSWNPVQLWHGELAINSLIANDITIHNSAQKQTPTRPSKNSSLSLPFKIRIDNLRLNHIRWYQAANKEPITIQKIKLNAQVNNNQFALNLELDADTAHIKIQGGYNNQWDLNWNITIPQLAQLIPSMKGNFDSTGRISGATNKPTITATLRANSLNYENYHIKNMKSILSLVINQNKQSTIQINSNKLNLHGKGLIAATKNSVKLSDFCFTQNSDHVCINGQWTPKKSNLKLNWVINNLNKLTALIPEISQLKGQLKGQLSIKNLTTKPVINGSFSLDNGAASIPDLDLSLSPITISGKITQNSLKYTGKLTSGPGILTIQGLTQLEGFEHTSQLTIKGNNVLVSNLPEYKIYASPDLTIKLNKTDLTLAGKLLIPSADIKPRNFSDTVTMPADVEYVDQPKKKGAEANFNITSNIALKLGDKVNINVKGVSGRLTGQLQIDDVPKQPTVATGQLNLVNGKYNAYGQSLDVTTGEINYHGDPIANPNINVRASRTIKQAPGSTSTIDTSNIVVGISATGRIRKPKITLFSSPSGLSQADILSYLIIGQPASQASGSKAQILLVAAQALTAGDSPGPIANLTNQVKNSLGLSELSIESVPTASSSSDDGPLQNTSLVLGKYLSPKLYVNYSIGLLDPISTVRVRYSLSKNWAIQTESNTLGNGIDILYSFEH